MENLMRIVETVNGAINDFVWGVPCLVLLIGTGLYYTIRLGFMQFRHPVFLFKETVLKALEKNNKKNLPEITERNNKAFEIGYNYAE